MTKFTPGSLVCTIGEEARLTLWPTPSSSIGAPTCGWFSSGNVAVIVATDERARNSSSILAMLLIATTGGVGWIRRSLCEVLQ